MPRVSAQHLAARRQQILDAARVCFGRNGFHATSMQDIIREAGMSVGAVYRYFPSKDALIAEIAQEVVGPAAALLEELAQREPVPGLDDAMIIVIDAMEPGFDPDGVLRIAIQVWAEAIRDPNLATLAAGVFGVMRGQLAVLAGRLRDAGGLPAGTDPAAIAGALFALVPGYAVQRMVTGSPDRAAFTGAVRTLLAPFRLQATPTAG